MKETPAKPVCHAQFVAWSSDYPKSAGLYWVRYHGQKREIVSLTGDPGNLKQRFYGERVGLHNLPKELGWQWAGPIPEPQETQTAPAVDSFAYSTIEKFEEIVEFKVNDAFRTGWTMARLMNSHFTPFRKSANGPA